MKQLSEEQVELGIFNIKFSKKTMINNASGI